MEDYTRGVMSLFQAVERFLHDPSYNGFLLICSDSRAILEVLQAGVCDSAKKGGCTAVRLDNKNLPTVLLALTEPEREQHDVKSYQTADVLVIADFECVAGKAMCQQLLLENVLKPRAQTTSKTVLLTERDPFKESFSESMKAFLKTAEKFSA